MRHFFLTFILAVLPFWVSAQDDASSREPVGDGVARSRNHNLEVGKQLDIFNSVYRNLDLIYVDTLDPQSTITAAIDGMMRSLDPYTEYYPESETKDLQLMLTGKYAGIGALVKYHLGRKRVVVDEPYEGMPAAEAGVKKGDVILSIDDSVMTGKQVSYVSSRLRGDAGTTFLLKVLRPTTGKEMKFKITRRNIKLPELPYYGVTGAGGKVGYIVLNQFTEGSAQGVRNAFIDLKKRGVTSCVLDLRGNGGGSEMEAVDLVSIWVPKGQLVVENRGKVAQASRRYSTRLEPVDTLMPLAVLVSGETASASEITAGALQDLDRAIIIGTRTYGKGLVQVPLEMPYNTNVKITTSKYYIPSGRCIQAINYSRHASGSDRVESGYKERIADSLTHVFATRGGREVRDGGGIKPDVEVKNDTLPNIAYYLSASGLDSTEVMFDYVVDYVSRHPSIAAASEFRLSDADYAEFCEKVVQSGFKYDLLSSRRFSDLVRTAKAEGYYEQSRQQFDALEACLRHDVRADLSKHAATIRQLLELDIVSAYYYQRGAIEANMRRDKQLGEACRLLQSDGGVDAILRP